MDEQKRKLEDDFKSISMALAQKDLECEQLKSQVNALIEKIKELEASLQRQVKE